MFLFPEFLYPFFEWCDNTWLGGFVRDNSYVFPFVETVHIVALTILVGCILLIDLRILGIAVRKLTAFQMNRELKPFMNWGLVVILGTGVLLFLSEAVKCYDNEAFGPKMLFLGLALVIHFTGHRKALSIDAEHLPLWTKGVAVLSLAFWFLTGWAGRAIGFI